MVRLGKQKDDASTRHLCVNGIGTQMNTTVEEVEQVFAAFGTIEEIQMPEDKVFHPPSIASIAQWLVDC